MAFGKVGEHLDAAEIAAHLVVQVAGDPLADPGQLALFAHPVADRQGDQHQRPGPAEQREGPQAGAAPAVDDRRGFALQRVPPLLQLQALVELHQPGAARDQPAVRAEAVAEAGGIPVLEAGADHVAHAVGRAHHRAGGAILLALQHLDLAEGEEGRVVLEDLPKLVDIDPHLAPAARTQRHVDRVVARIAHLHPRSLRRFAAAIRHRHAEAPRKAEAARQVGGRPFGGEQPQRVEGALLAEIDLEPDAVARLRPAFGNPPDIPVLAAGNFRQPERCLAVDQEVVLPQPRGRGRLAAGRADLGTARQIALSLEHEGLRPGVNEAFRNIGIEPQPAGGNPQAGGFDRWRDRIDERMTGAHRVRPQVPLVGDPRDRLAVLVEQLHREFVRHPELRFQPAHAVAARGHQRHQVDLSRFRQAQLHGDPALFLRALLQRQDGEAAGPALVARRHRRQRGQLPADVLQLAFHLRQPAGNRVRQPVVPARLLAAQPGRKQATKQRQQVARAGHRRRP